MWGDLEKRTQWAGLLEVSSTTAELIILKTALISLTGSLLPRGILRKIRERLFWVILCPSALSRSSSNLSCHLILSYSLCSSCWELWSSYTRQGEGRAALDPLHTIPVQRVTRLLAQHCRATAAHSKRVPRKTYVMPNLRMGGRLSHVSSKPTCPIHKTRNFF